MQDYGQPDSEQNPPPSPRQDYYDDRYPDRDYGSEPEDDLNRYWLLERDYSKRKPIEPEPIWVALFAILTIVLIFIALISPWYSIKVEVSFRGESQSLKSDSTLFEAEVPETSTGRTEKMSWDEAKDDADLEATANVYNNS